MIFKVRKVFFYAVILVVVSLIILVVLSEFIFTSGLRCPLLKSYGGEMSECGYLNSDSIISSSTTYWISGAISDIEQGNDTYMLLFITTDLKQKAIDEIITIPPSVKKISLTTKSKTPAEVSELISIDQLAGELKPGQEIQIGLLMPDADRDKKLGEVISDPHFISCFSYNQAYINYLKDPGLFNKALLLKEKYVEKCNISVLQFLIYK